MHPMKSLLQYENIVIYGFGKEGKSTYRLLRKLFPDKRISIYDAKHIDGDGLIDVTLFCGDASVVDLTKYDLVIKSPGIVFTQEQLASIRNMTSQTELFLRVFAKQTIGITGTKGKSTTSSLLFHILKTHHSNTFLAGNIGIPCFDIIDDMDEDSIVVFEMSCHQLEYTKVSPHIAIFLNVFEEHLDHYGTLEAYVLAKRNIMLHQTANDTVFIHQSIGHLAKGVSSKVVTVGSDGSDIEVNGRDIRINQHSIVIHHKDTFLLGQHNVGNIAFVYGVCKTLFNMDDELFKTALATFHGLAHRLELFAEIDGVRYYDDSISTASETTIQALRSIDQIGVVILGGMDRHINYSSLADYIAKHYFGNIILMPGTSTRIYELLSSRIDAQRLSRVHQVSDLKEAVFLAKRLAKKGEAVVLSPAAASYGFFKDFEDRGNTFQRLVRAQDN